jgi:hypothetical protein
MVIMYSIWETIVLMDDVHCCDYDKSCLLGLDALWPDIAAVSNVLTCAAVRV